MKFLSVAKPQTLVKPSADMMNSSICCFIIIIILLFLTQQNSRKLILIGYCQLIEVSCVSDVPWCQVFLKRCMFATILSVLLLVAVTSVCPQKSFSLCSVLLACFYACACHVLCGNFTTTVQLADNCFTVYSVV